MNSKLLEITANMKQPDEEKDVLLWKQAYRLYNEISQPSHILPITLEGLILQINWKFQSLNYYGGFLFELYF